MATAPEINMKKTGKRIRQLCQVNNVSVRDLQKYLMISCPQSVYNWFHGKTLPSLDHLFALSALFHIPMNWMLVAEYPVEIQWTKRRLTRIPQTRRLNAYRIKHTTATQQFRKQQ